MKRKIITTADGSKTIFIEDWNEHYHSKHGAIQEAYHVFIKNGFQHFTEANKPENISILEIGFGTGLNAFITLLEASKSCLKINYVGVEAYPVGQKEIEHLNYAEILSEENIQSFKMLHSSPWESKYTITDNFALTKKNLFFNDISEEDQYDIIYFDAFGSRVQPELWTKDIFSKMYKALKKNGVLVTYAAIGKVKRDMMSLGFEVERLQGPPGKRHMLRATK